MASIINALRVVIDMDKKAMIRNHILLKVAERDEIPSIKTLFERSFPIRYEDAFYDSLANGLFQGRPVTTIVMHYTTTDCANTIGCIVYQARPIDGSDVYAPSIYNTKRGSYAIYILNIAVLEKYRRYGLGSILIEDCIARVSSDTLCAGIYLHVLSTNLENQRFYEDNGFKRVQRFENYYLMNDQFVDSFIYFYPFHKSFALPNVNGYKNNGLNVLLIAAICLVGFSIVAYNAKM